MCRGVHHTFGYCTNAVPASSLHVHDRIHHYFSARACPLFPANLFQKCILCMRAFKLSHTPFIYLRLFK